MEDRLDKIDEKLDRIEDKISNIDITITRQAKDIEHHIYRTDLAEQNINLLRTELQPIKKHVALLDAGLKIIGILASIITFVAGIYKLVIQ